MRTYEFWNTLWFFPIQIKSRIVVSQLRNTHLLAVAKNRKKHAECRFRNTKETQQKEETSSFVFRISTDRLRVVTDFLRGLANLFLRRTFVKVGALPWEILLVSGSKSWSSLRQDYKKHFSSFDLIPKDSWWETPNWLGYTGGTRGPGRKSRFSEAIPWDGHRFLSQTLNVLNQSERHEEQAAWSTIQYSGARKSYWCLCLMPAAPPAVHGRI